MHRSPGSEIGLTGIPSYKSFDSNAPISVRSNSRFYKAVKEEGYRNQHLSMPMSALKGVDLSNMPLKQIPFRLTQHPRVPFAITASDNAIYQEFSAKERERLKQEKIERFLVETKMRVSDKNEAAKNKSSKNLQQIEKIIRGTLSMAIAFSMKTNMIKKSGSNVGHEDVEGFRGGPPTFNETEGEHRFNDTNRSTGRRKNIDLSELQSALEEGKPREEIISVIDKIIDKQGVPISEELKQLNEKEHDRVSSRAISPGVNVRYDTPEFDYTKLQAEASKFGIAPRDFDAQVPLLRLLGLQNYDREDFSHLNVVKSLSLLRQLWAS